MSLSDCLLINKPDNTSNNVLRTNSTKNLSEVHLQPTDGINNVEDSEEFLGFAATLVQCLVICLSTYKPKECTALEVAEQGQCFRLFWEG